MATASPFNVKSNALSLDNFTKELVSQLLDQHTTETYQGKQLGIVGMGRCRTSNYFGSLMP